MLPPQVMDFHILFPLLWSSLTNLGYPIVLLGWKAQSWGHKIKSQHLQGALAGWYLELATTQFMNLDQTWIPTDIFRKI